MNGARRSAGLAAALAVTVACSVDGRAQEPRMPDAAAAEALIAAVRGAGPVLCELAARTIENRWGWGGRGPFGTNRRDATVRATLAFVNERHGDPAAVAPLAAALHDDDACVRRVAAPLLGRITDPRAREALQSALNDARPETREAAATGLGYTDDHGMVAPLITALRDGEAGVRTAAAWALGQIEDHRAVEPLSRLLWRDPDPDVRAAAATALGEIEG